MLTRLKYENETTLGRLVRLTVDAEIGLDTSTCSPWRQFCSACVLISATAVLRVPITPRRVSTRIDGWWINEVLPDVPSP